MSRAPATAVLLMAYGSPNNLDEVGEYLTHVRGGKKPTRDEVEKLKRRYERVGGSTPLLRITLSQASGLEKKLQSEGFSLDVHVGMKHWHPFIDDVVPRIVQDGAASIVGVALAPHFSRLSIGGYEEAVKRGLAKQNRDVSFTMVRNWHREPWLIRALSGRVIDRLALFDSPSEAVVLFSAHSLPNKSVAADDPYRGQLLETSRLVAEEAGARFWDFGFQSAGRPEDAWLGPQLKEQVSRLSRQGCGGILVCPVGFVSDHLEILYDLDVEAKEYAGSLGVQLERTASLNDDPLLLEALASVVRSTLVNQPLVHS